MNNLNTVYLLTTTDCNRIQTNLIQNCNRAEFVKAAKTSSLGSLKFS